jgi:hypothetical protein
MMTTRVITRVPQMLEASPVFALQTRVLQGIIVQKLIHSPVDNSGIDKAFPEVPNDGFSRTGRGSSHSRSLVDKVIHKHRFACG